MRRNIFTYNGVLYFVLTCGLFFLIFSYYRKRVLIEDFSITQAVVIYIGQASGKTVRIKEFTYSFYLNDKEYHRSTPIEKYYINVGDTIMIKYSNIDPRISEVLYDKLKQVR